MKMNQILRGLFTAASLLLFTVGCSSFVDKNRPETCIQTPFLKTVNEYPGNKQFQIAYYAQDSFFTASLDGKDKVAWSNGIYPLWASDRKNVAYQETDSICVVNEASNQVREIARGENISDLSWSPDGKYIVYSALKDHKQYEIYTVSLDGKVTQLTSSPKADEENPVWSPSGKKIAYVTRSDPVDTGGQIEYTLTISIVDTLSRQTLSIARDGVKPVWSPDENTLLFESVDHKICVVDINSANKLCLTTGFTDYGQQWSPDGKRIAFTRIDKDWSIYVMNADGTEPTWLANGIFPVWSPDGKRIVFSTGGENPNLYIINSDGTEPILVAKNVWGYMWVHP